MSKKRRGDTRSTERDLFPIASEPPSLLPFSRPTRSSLPLSEVEDRRLFVPPGVSHTPRLAGSRPARVRIPAGEKAGRKSALGRVGFSFPQFVIRCVRRKIRREVLFGLKRTRKGSRAGRRRRDFWSGVHC